MCETNQYAELLAQPVAKKDFLYFRYLQSLWKRRRLEGKRYKQISSNTQAKDGDHTTGGNCIWHSWWKRRLWTDTSYGRRLSPRGDRASTPRPKASDFRDDKKKTKKEK